MSLLWIIQMYRYWRGQYSDFRENSYFISEAHDDFISVLKSSYVFI
jgi:hypothetical protein